MTTTDQEHQSPIGSWGDDCVQLNDRVSVLVGADNGRYPSGNSVLVDGGAERALIDPSVTVVERGGAPVGIDVVLNSHGHEDHVAGNGLYPRARVHAHTDDVAAVRSLEGLLDVYGFSGDARSAFATTVVEEFHYEPRPDASGFGDGHVFDLGAIGVEALHLPGHTRGHCGFLIGDVFFLSDIDLTGFGPYYGDAWSDLEQFEASLAIARDVDARWYVTFHHKGIVDGRTAYLELIDAFTDVIQRRHAAMLEYLTTPHTVTEMVERRFVYRAHVDGDHIDDVERRTAELHVARMIARGEVTEVDPGRYRAIGQWAASAP